MENRQALPWGINTIASPYHPGVQAGLPDGRYARAVCEPHGVGRLRAAWWVLTGRAHAFLWPKAGELENVYNDDDWKRQNESRTRLSGLRRTASGRTGMPAKRVIMSSEVQADWCAEYVKAREALADMMTRAGLTTDNGKTFDDLLSEAEWQIERLQRIAGERYAPPPH